MNRTAAPPCLFRRLSCHVARYLDVSHGWDAILAKPLVSHQRDSCCESFATTLCPAGGTLACVPLMGQPFGQGGQP